MHRILFIFICFICLVKGQDFEGQLSCPHCHKNKMDKEFLSRLKVLENNCSINFYITSGYRCEVQNEAVGGNIYSRHLEGLAVDIRIYDSSNINEIKHLARKSDYFTRVYDEGDHIHIGTGDDTFAFRVLDGNYSRFSGADRFAFSLLSKYYNINLLKGSQDISKYKILNFSYYAKEGGEKSSLSCALYSVFEAKDENGSSVEYNSLLGMGVTRLFPIMEEYYLGIKGDLRFHWLAWQKGLNKNYYTPGVELTISLDSHFSGLELSYLKTFPPVAGSSIEGFSINYYLGISSGYFDTY